MNYCTFTRQLKLTNKYFILDLYIYIYQIISMDNLLGHCYDNL